jgi:hypothetical protein
MKKQACENGIEEDLACAVLEMVGHANTWHHAVQ